MVACPHTTETASIGISTSAVVEGFGSFSSNDCYMKGRICGWIPKYHLFAQNPWLSIPGGELGGYWDAGDNLAILFRITRQLLVSKWE